jgi:hypothetical protein
MSTLKDSIAILSSKPAPSKTRLQAIADVNAEISALETALGLPHSMPTLNQTRALAKLEKLQAANTGKGTAATPASARAPVLPAVISNLPANVRPLAEYLELSVDNRRQFIADGLGLTYADFSRMNVAQKSAYCVANGKILADTPTNLFRPTAAASFGDK